MPDRRHRVVLLDADLRRVLVGGGAEGPALPSRPGDWLSHGDALALIADPRAIAIVPPWCDTDDWVTSVFAASDEPRPAGEEWMPVAELAGRELSVSSYERLVAAIDQWRAGRRDDDRPEWFVRGWRAEVDAWVDEELGDRGLARGGEAMVAKLWSLSAVLRYRTTGEAPRDVWVKATCDRFRDEPQLTRTVAAIDASLVPGVLATNRARAWMLMEDVPGAGGERPPVFAPALAAAHASLQLRALTRLDELRVAGAPLRDAEETISWLHEIVADSVELPLMSDELRAGASAAEPWIADRVREFHAVGVPLTLVHGDLHLGNVADVDGHPVIFDWTDTCIAHPYLDARLLARSVPEIAPDVRDAYLAPWRAAYPHVDHERAWELSDIAERVFQAVSYERIARAQPEASRWELATVVVQLLERLTDAYAAAN